jgi:hypothetical protein
MGKNPGRRRRELTERIDRLETWFVTALIALITVLGGAVIALLVRF